MERPRRGPSVLGWLADHYQAAGAYDPRTSRLVGPVRVSPRQPLQGSWRKVPGHQDEIVRPRLTQLGLDPAYVAGPTVSQPFHLERDRRSDATRVDEYVP